MDKAHDVDKGKKILIVCRAGKWEMGIYDIDEEPTGAAWWFESLEGFIQNIKDGFV